MQNYVHVANIYKSNRKCCHVIDAFFHCNVLIVQNIQVLNKIPDLIVEFQSSSQRGDPGQVPVPDCPGLTGILPKTAILARLTTLSIFHPQLIFLNHISGISTVREGRNRREQRRRRNIMTETISNLRLTTLLE